MSPSKATSNAGPSITIALIEDNRLVREGLTSMINQQPGLKVILGQASGEPREISKLTPDVVLLDIGLRRGDSHKERRGEADPASRCDDIRGQTEQRTDGGGSEQADGEDTRAGDGVGDEDILEIEDRHVGSPFDPLKLDSKMNGVDYA